jgi:hypothetical protein
LFIQICLLVLQGSRVVVVAVVALTVLVVNAVLLRGDVDVVTLLLVVAHFAKHFLKKCPKLSY